jgi:hypothetical protein
MSIVNQLTDQVASLTGQLNAANARIATLKALAPFDVRKITKTAFRARLFAYIDKTKLFDLISENDTAEIRRVTQVVKNQPDNLAVDLDGQPIQNLLNDFVTLQLLSAQQVIDIKRDATAQEAFV